jgi:hypothetical protein
LIGSSVTITCADTPLFDVPDGQPQAGADLTGGQTVQAVLSDSVNNNRETWYPVVNNGIIQGWVEAVCMG